MPRPSPMFQTSCSLGLGAELPALLQNMLQGWLKLHGNALPPQQRPLAARAQPLNRQVVGCPLELVLLQAALRIRTCSSTSACTESLDFLPEHLSFLLFGMAWMVPDREGSFVIVGD